MALTIFLLGIILRLFMLAGQRSFWGDEWESIAVANETLKNVLMLNVQDKHPPLYFLLLHGSIRLFGFEEWAFRLPSLLGGIGALWGIYLCAKELFDRKTALWTLFFAAISPYFIHLSFEIRNHGLPVFFTSFGTYFFLKMLKDPGKKKWGLGYVFSAAAAVYTQHFVWFWVGAILLYHRFVARKDQKARQCLAWQRVAVGFSAAGALLLLLHSEKEAFFQDYFRSAAMPAVLRHSLREATGVFWHVVIGPIFSLNDAYAALLFRSGAFPLWPAVVLAAAALVLMVLSSKKILAGLIIFLPLAAVILINPSRLDARYFGFAAPFLIMLFANGLANLGSRTSRMMLAALFAIVWLQGNIFMFRSPTDPLNREDYLELARFLSSRTDERDVIYCKVPLIRYYSKRLAIPIKAVLDPDPDPRYENLASFDRVWILDGAPVDAAYFPARDKLKSVGFEPLGKEMFFGEKITVNVFEKRLSGANPR